MSPPTPLPSRPSLEQLKDQAADLRRDQPDVSVAQSLYMVARAYGFESWPLLKHYVESLTSAAAHNKEITMSTPAHAARKELYTFTQQLATLMMSGVPVLEAFEICADTAVTPSFKAALLDVRSKLREGEGIATPLRSYPQYFDGMYVQLVSAGEETGTLDVMLDRIAAFIETTERFGPPNPAVFFTRQLATMLKAGLPLVNSLSIIAENTEEPNRGTPGAPRDVREALTRMIHESESVVPSMLI